MKHSILKTLFFLALAFAAVGSDSKSFAQILEITSSSEADKILIRKGFVNDFTNLFDRSTKEKLEQTLKEFKFDTKVDFVIVTVNTTGKESAFDYSLSLAKKWKVGRGNSGEEGILMLVSVEDRRWHIQISRGLEKIVSNAKVAEFGAEMRPFFQKQQYGEGVTACVNKFIEELGDKGLLKAKLNNMDRGEKDISVF